MAVSWRRDELSWIIAAMNLKDKTFVIWTLGFLWLGSFPFFVAESKPGFGSAFLLF